MMYQRKGEKNCSAKLTQAQVNEIREALHSSLPHWGIQTRLANQYHISKQTIHYIKTGQRWNSTYKEDKKSAR
jgi:hypothetical protein